MIVELCIYIYNNGKNNIDWSRNHDCDTYIYEYILSHHGMVMQTCMFIKRTWNSETIYILIYIYIFNIHSGDMMCIKSTLQSKLRKYNLNVASYSHLFLHVK